jgi:FtsH-binding integral membrane protein
MLGFGSAKFNQGTFGKGVMVGHGSPVSTSTVNTFGIAQWESTHSLAYSTSAVLMFGGLIHGATGYIQGTGTMYSSPVFQWAGFGDIETAQGTVLTFGYIAWDGQLIDDATWTTQTVN